jgi:hypothetical protein
LHVNSTTFLSIVFLVVIITCTVEIPRIVNQDPGSIASGGSPAVALSALRRLPTPSYRRGFDSPRALLENVKLGKFILIRLQSPREWKNRTRLDEYYFFYYPIPPEDDS